MKISILLPTRFGYGTVSHCQTVFITPGTIAGIIGENWFEDSQGRICVCDSLGFPAKDEDGFDRVFTPEQFAETYLRDRNT